MSNKYRTPKFVQQQALMASVAAQENVWKSPGNAYAPIYHAEMLAKLHEANEARYPSGRMKADGTPFSYDELHRNALAQVAGTLGWGNPPGFRQQSDGEGEE